MRKTLGFILCVIGGGCNYDTLPVNDSHGSVTFSYNVSVADTSWKNDTVIAEISLDSSRSRWESIKNKTGHNYMFLNVFSSWTGCRISDSILVINDTVKEVIKTIEKFGDGGFVLDTQYLISKENDELKRYKSIDDIYVFAKDSVISRDTSQFIVSIEINKYGILRSVYFRDKRCVDDCNVGYNVNRLEFVTLDIGPPNKPLSFQR